MPLSTKRLIIQAPDPDKAADVNAAIVASLDTLSRWMHWADHAPTVEETRTRLADAKRRFESGTDCALLLWHHESKSFIGASGVHARSQDADRREIGYWIADHAAGRGYATEAVGTIATAAFDAFDVDVLEIRASERNHASHRVAQNAGFTLTDIVEDGRVDPDGVGCKSHVYERRRGD